MTSKLIGIVAVGHGNLTTAMVDAVRKIMPDAQQITSVEIDSNAPVEENRKKIGRAIQAVDQDVGVLLLTDMFGGTPSNLCLSFLKPNRIEVISGLNLPMLIKLLGGMQQQHFNEVVTFIQRYGQKNIVIASHVLQGKLD
ncbi:MAG: PTS sugar transporter subunit IIA [Deltaproteobacteria bacterium]|nr:PTS sugar transporter subunit IIA [Deltaproteobacteria bacterium]